MQIMGILNVTPDSFSDGGHWNAPELAIAHGRELAADGADIIDIGGESTRPGARRVTVAEEWQRIKLVVETLVAEGLTVSVDTVNSATAELALTAGAAMINDVSGGSYDPQMNSVLAGSNAKYVIQHWRGFPADPNLNTHYENVKQQVLAETEIQVNRAILAGVDQSQVIIDPGLGFALTGPDSWQLVENLETWTASGYPVLVGASRKRFVREKYGDAVEAGTLAVTKRCFSAGVWAVRVHNVEANLDEIRRLQAATTSAGRGE